MRFKPMSADARAALDRVIPEQDRTPEGRAEREIEKKRKGAIRLSWLDQRGRAAQETRTRALHAFNVSLRGHLRRWHPDVELPESEWDLDRIHEKAHGRRREGGPARDRARRRRRTGTHDGRNR